MRCAKRILVNKFEDYNIPKLINVLSLIDNLIITFTIGDLQLILDKTNTLRENILYLFIFKQFVKSNVDCDNYYTSSAKNLFEMYLQRVK